MKVGLRLLPATYVESCERQPVLYVLPGRSEMR